MGSTHRRRRVWWPSVSTAVAFTALCILPIALSSADESYWLQFSTRVLLLGSLALSADLAWGYAGIFTLGHALLFGAGAYTTGLLATRRGWIELQGLLPVSVVAGGLLAFAIGLFLYAGGRRVGGVYVSLATLALAYAAERLANGWPALGAANGIPGLPLPKLFGYEIDLGIRFYFVAFAAFVVGYVVLRVIARSQFGLALTAVRDDEERAEFLGFTRVSGSRSSRWWCQVCSPGWPAACTACTKASSLRVSPAWGCRPRCCCGSCSVVVAASGERCWAW